MRELGPNVFVCSTGSPATVSLPIPLYPGGDWRGQTGEHVLVISLPQVYGIFIIGVRF